MEQPLLVVPRDTPLNAEDDAAEWDALPVAEAAQRLGMSKAAIRQRIRRGSLPATKRDGEWYAHVPRSTTRDNSGSAPRDISSDATEHATEHVTSSTPAPDLLGQTVSLA